MTPSVLVCRGCCCGTARKHPDVAQLASLRAVARTRVVDCVDECSRSNVVIVRTGRGRSTWFGGVLGPAVTASLCDWLSSGATEPLPEELQALRFERGVTAEPVRLGRPA